MNNYYNNVKLKRLIKQQKQKTKILALIAIVIALIAIIPIQTLFWLKNNTKQKPRWFNQTQTEKTDFKTH